MNPTFSRLIVAQKIPEISLCKFLEINSTLNVNTIGLRPHMQKLDWQLISPKFSLEVKRLPKLDHIKVEEFIAKVYLSLNRYVNLHYRII